MRLLLLAIASLCLPGCVGYVLSSGYHQAELMLSRKPVEKVRSQELLAEDRLEALDVVADAKEFGAALGLAATDDYEHVAVGFDRTIYVVTGCEPLSFTPRTKWFPVVGRVSYLGFFREQAAERERRRLERRGYETYVRTAGAYSTLGWFKDPLLKPMLDWPDPSLAGTVFHELAHTTLWIPGSVDFNESFATFVGEEATRRWLADRHGPDSEALRAWERRQEDRRTWRRVLHALYADLDAVYTDPDLADPARRERKQALFDALPERVEAAPFHDPAPWLRSARDGPWNNARLIEFRNYHAGRDRFAALLAQHDGDLLAFIEAVERLAKQDRDDPYGALEHATRDAPPAGPSTR